jgi:hypothetical protein
MKRAGHLPGALPFCSTGRADTPRTAPETEDGEDRGETVCNGVSWEH